MTILFWSFRYWSFAIPIYAGVAVVVVFILYFAKNMANNEPLDSFHTLTGWFESVAGWHVANNDCCFR